MHTTYVSSRRFSSLFQSVLTSLFLLFLGSWIAFDAQAQVVGKVFRDFNADGFQNTPISSTASAVGEPGFPGIIVTAYPATGTPVSVTSGVDGSYSFPNSGVTASGAKLRIEFSGLPTGAYSAPYNASATGSGTSAQFVTAGSSTTANYAANFPSEYCNSAPLLTIPCFVSGDALGTNVDNEHVVVTFPYSASSTLSGVTVTNSVNPTPIADAGQVGSVWGIAYQRETKRLFSSAFLKRHVGLGAGGLGGIYSTTNATGTIANASLYVDLEAAPFNLNLGQTELGTRALPNDASASSTDPNSFTLIGKAGLGSMAMSEDGSKLYVVDLYNRQLLILNIGNPAKASLVAGDLTRVALPASATCANGVARPFAVSIYRGKAYVGVVCTAESPGSTSANLSATVYVMDEVTQTFSPTNVFSAPLTYPKGYVHATQTANGAQWEPWISTFSGFHTTVLSSNPTVYRTSRPQPMLSDIDFTDNGDMVLSFMDRTGHQLGYEQVPPTGAASTDRYNGYIGGDILRARLQGSNWILESAGKVSSTTSGTLTGCGPTNGEGPGNGEFYCGDNYLTTHEETAQGGAVIIPGTNVTVSIHMDPLVTWSGGTIWFDNTTGSDQKRYQLYRSTDDDGITYGKANGLGLPVALCDPAPVEIGNRVWLDKDNDGIQDPDETPIASVSVGLYQSGTLVATAVTNAKGEYYFSSATGTSTTAVRYGLALVRGGAYELRILTTQSSLVGLLATSPSNAGANDLIDNDFSLSGLNLVSSLTLGLSGNNVHTYDAGLTCQPPTLAISPSQSICQGGSFALPLSGSVTSGLATGQQWYFTDATGSSFTVISGATSLTFSPGAGQQPATTGGVRYYALTAYSGTTACSATEFVSLTVKPTQTITFSAPASATTTVCANTTLTMSVSTNALAPDQIRFVYFNEALTSPSDAYTASGGTVLGTVNSTTATGTKTITLPNAQLPDNQGDASSAIYVYAILISADGLCQPVSQRVIVLNPRPIPAISGDAQICQGSSATLSASGPAGMTFQWFLNNGTSAASTANPYITPAINTNTTYRLRGMLSGCVSDDVQFDLTPVPCTPCISNTASIGGIVYRDFNSDGINNSSPGIGAVTVTLFRCDTDGSSVQVAQMQTDIKGQYSFTGLTAGTTYRVEFSNLPAGYEPTYKGTNNGTTAQFVLPGTCNASLGLNQPADYCQTNPRMVTPCYIDGAVSPNNGLSDVLVSFDYNVVGSSPTNKTMDAARTDIGSTWGLAYAKTTKLLYASAFLKRHVGLKDAKLGQIYLKNYNTPSAAPTPWLDISTLPGIAGSWTYLTDAQRGLGNAGSPTLDADAFAKIAMIGIGDIDISDDDKTLFVMDLTNRQLLSIDIATKTLNSRTPVPDVCTGTAGPAYYTASSKSFTAIDGKTWRKGVVFNTDNQALEYGQTITNPNSATAGTTDAALYATSVYTASNMGYSFPMGNGSYAVKMHFSTNLSVTNRNTTVRVESTTAISGLDVYAASGNQINLGLTRSFTAVVTDGVLSISVINGSGSSYAAVSGFEITPISGQAKGVTRPFATKYRNGKVYVGAVCDASFSQNRDDLQASVFTFDPTTNSFNATPVISYPLTYLRGSSFGAAKTGSNNRWEPWTSVYPNNTAYGIYFGGFDIYTQPVLADIEFDVDGSMLFGFFDRFPNQIGAAPNYRPDRPTSAGLTSNYGVVGGDILRAYYNGSSFELESNAKEGVSSSKAPTAGTNGLQGPGGGEFYYGDALPDLHNETSMGGLALLPGSGEVRLTSGDPLAAGSGGILTLSNATGAKITANSFTLYAGGGGGVQYKANGLGDLELLCNVAPIQIGNRVWRDDNRNGIQDPCEPPIAGVVVKLYDATKTTELASVTTNAAGEYYFSSGTVVAGTSTSSVATTALTYNTTYGLVITSLGTSTVVTSQGLLLTDVSPVTPGESGSINSGATIANNDANVDAGRPCIKLTTGDPGESNHTYDFGLAKFVCSLTATAQATSASVCTNQSVTVFATVSPAGNYTYSWAAPAGAIVSGGNTATATITGLTTTGVNTFTVTVSSSPGCFTTALATVSVVACPARLGDYVWFDTNGNGQQDGTETGVVNVTATLFNTSSSVPLATTLTDVNGNYLFTNLNPGSYYVVFTAPAGTTFTTANSGADASDSDVASLTGQSGSTGIYSLLAGEYNPTVDVGLIPLLGSIGDFVWKDANSNGIQDDGPNSGMSNVMVNLLQETSTPGQYIVVAATTTSTLGEYAFTGLPVGNYKVQVDLATVPFYCQPTAQTVVTPSDATNSKIGPTGETPVIVINPANPAQRDYPKADAGFSPLALGSIGDYVWKDTNNDGIQNDGATGVPNVGMKLLNADGHYVARGVLSGLQENPSVPTSGTGLVYASFNPTTNVLNLMAGFSNLTGMVTMAHIHTGVAGTNGPVIVDLVPLGFPIDTYAGNFVASTTLTAGQASLLLANKLYLNVHTTTNGGGEIRAQLAACEFTSSTGNYLFDNLPQGTYTIAVDTPTLPLTCVVSSKQNSTAANEATDSDFNPTTGRSDAVPLVPSDPAQRDIRTVDLALVNPTTGSIGNFVWKDNNNNGLQDPNEKGIANVTVELFTVVNTVRNSTPLATTVTSASGLYAFAGLPPGDYQLKFTLPASETVGCLISDKINAGDDTRDSDVDPVTGFSPVITINPSGTGLAVNNPTVDLGVKRRIYDPIGYIYCYETNTILTGGTIRVTGPGSITIIKDGSDGSYQFLTDGTPGTYRLSYTHPSGYSVATVQRPAIASSLDPTGLDGSPLDKDGVVDGWVQIGSLANSPTNPTSLSDGSAAANPYYLSFNVVGGDPYISENNLPIDCADPAVPCPAVCVPITIGKIVKSGQ